VTNTEFYCSGRIVFLMWWKRNQHNL